jgi:hypothetical protein
VFNGRLLPSFVIFFVHVYIKHFYKCSSKSEDIIFVANDYDAIVFRGRFFSTMFLFVSRFSNYSKALTQNQYDRTFNVQHFLVNLACTYDNAKEQYAHTDSEEKTKDILHLLKRIMI